jgi:hypothetical protein
MREAVGPASLVGGGAREARRRGGDGERGSSCPHFPSPPPLVSALFRASLRRGREDEMPRQACRRGGARTARLRDARARARKTPATPMPPIPTPPGGARSGAFLVPLGPLAQRWWRRGASRPRTPLPARETPPRKPPKKQRRNQTKTRSHRQPPTQNPKKKTPPPTAHPLLGPRLHPLDHQLRRPCLEQQQLHHRRPPRPHLARGLPPGGKTGQL